jgi:uncharacterized MAPEG superfamily protein
MFAAGGQPVNTSILALLGYLGLTIALVLTVVSYRLAQIATGKSADSWARGRQQSDPDVIQRFSHAHLNCLENLPLFAGVVLAAVGSNQLGVVDPLAGWFLAARIAQSTTHVIQVSHWMVLVRGTFWTVQMLMLIYWVLALAHLV